jgi:uncharacterized protein YndB with AHSA1/START domain
MQVEIGAPPEAVFGFLVDAEKMTRWMGLEAWADAKEGGAVRCRVSPGDTFSGTFLAVEPPHRVVFTFGWEAPDNPIRPGSSTVEVTLTPNGAGTLLKLRHTGLPADAEKDHEQGWGMFLPRLAAVAEGRDPGANPEMG